MHSVMGPNANIASEYAEVTQIMPKTNISAPPEPYATVNLKLNFQYSIIN